MKGRWVLREKMGSKEISAQDNHQKGEDMGTGDYCFWVWFCRITNDQMLKNFPWVEVNCTSLNYFQLFFFPTHHPAQVTNVLTPPLLQRIWLQVSQGPLVQGPRGDQRWQVTPVTCDFPWWQRQAPGHFSFVSVSLMGQLTWAFSSWQMCLTLYWWREWNLASLTCGKHSISLVLLFWLQKNPEYRLPHCLWWL